MHKYTQLSFTLVYLENRHLLSGNDITNESIKNNSSDNAKTDEMFYLILGSLTLSIMATAYIYPELFENLNPMLLAQGLD